MTPGTITLGVAIAIPPPHADVLARCRRAAGDRSAELVFPHVTLLPPTDVRTADLGAVAAHLGAAAAASEPFAMHLSGTGTFRPVSPVVFVQVATGLADCETLERAVRGGPLWRELEFGYHPHVTIAQDVGDAALDRAYEGLSDFAARFTVAALVLYRRDGAARWHRHTEFGLGARSSAIPGATR